MYKPTRLPATLLATALMLFSLPCVFAQHRLHNAEEEKIKSYPWMNPSLSPDERADMVLKELTLDEKIDLVHGNGMPGWGKPRPNATWATAARDLCLACHDLEFPSFR